VSQADFESWCDENRAVLAARREIEVSLAAASASLSHPGSCGPCLRRTVFTSATDGGELLDDGRIVPNWSEQCVCDCADRLPGRARALLHFVESAGQFGPWTRLITLGPPGPADRRLAALAGTRIPLLRLPARALRLPLEDASAHVVVADSYLHHAPLFDETLAELHRVLAPGGLLAFTVPFPERSPHTVSHADDSRRRVGGKREAHEIGWDILQRLRNAGFAHAAAHGFWSAELGYLGAFNMVLAAYA
jgi:SAM-dependent methyltransferase